MMRILIGATARASGFRKTGSHSGCLCYQPPLRGNFMGLPGLCRRKWAIRQRKQHSKSKQICKVKTDSENRVSNPIFYTGRPRERGSVWPGPPNLLAAKLMLTRSQASNSISPALPTPASLSGETVLLPCQPTDSVTIPPSQNLAVNPSQPSSVLREQGTGPCALRELFLLLKGTCGH